MGFRKKSSCFGYFLREKSDLPEAESVSGIRDAGRNGKHFYFFQKSLSKPVAIFGFCDIMSSGRSGHVLIRPVRVFLCCIVPCVLLSCREVPEASHWKSGRSLPGKERRRSVFLSSIPSNFIEGGSVMRGIPMFFLLILLSAGFPLRGAEQYLSRREAMRAAGDFKARKQFY